MAADQLIRAVPAWACPSSGLDSVVPKSRYDLTIAPLQPVIDGERGNALAVNGTVPGPVVRLREGDEANLNVTNMLDTDSSIHWHGILLPFPMDGVPGVTFRGIPPGDTYHYRFRVKQAGTYWYHSHKRFQIQSGVYGPLIIDPKEPEPFSYEREHVIVLSDWSFEDPETIFRNISIDNEYYKYQRRTVGEFFSDVSKDGLMPTVRERMAWGTMRMSPVDLSDVTGAAYTYLVNGHSPDMNWTGLFTPGETIRLRIINASSMTNFDIRIPDQCLTVVAADGRYVKPVVVHELRIGVAEVFDVLVKLDERAYTLFAESMDRSGYARATLAPELGMQADVPALRSRPVRTLESVGMGMMAHSAKQMRSMEMSSTSDDPNVPGPNGPKPFMPDENGPGVAMTVMNPKSRLSEPGIGLGSDGWRVLTYCDLVSIEPQIYASHPDREMTINLTSNMTRYMFSLDGKMYSEQDGPYLFKYYERLRLYMVNHTMMEHPMHLHGMWMQLENGSSSLPFKHTILVKPGEVLSVLITPVEKGDWAFHCHLLYHMEAGMFQVVRVA